MFEMPDNGLDPHPTTSLLRRHGSGDQAEPLIQQIGDRMIRQIHYAICQRRRKMTAARAGKDDKLRSLSGGLQHYALEDRRHRSGTAELVEAVV
ncbi:MAG: hypothetical protein KI792_09205 [Alphaproteobacteria bacterium]|nr:hypothetical protein [Alphaproteobacteria bacterium SS10]